MWTRAASPPRTAGLGIRGGARPARRWFRLILALGVASLPALPIARAQEGGAAESGQAPAARDEHALGIHVGRIAAAGDDLIVDLSIQNLIDPITEEALERGVPVTLVLGIEVWRERSAWFDRLEASCHLAYKLQLDTWDEVYVVRDIEGRQEVFLDLAEARGALEDRRDVSVAPLSALRDDSSYYLVVTAALKPLTVEDVEELEGWLSGEIESDRARKVGLLGLPRAFFGVILDLTGFGARDDELRTPSFRRGELPGDVSSARAARHGQAASVSSRAMFIKGK